MAPPIPPEPYLVSEPEGSRLVTPFWYYRVKIDPVTGERTEVTEPTPLGHAALHALLRIMRIFHRSERLHR